VVACKALVVHNNLDMASSQRTAHKHMVIYFHKSGTNMACLLYYFINITSFKMKKDQKCTKQLMKTAKPAC